jgi:hypothetical protein
MLDQSKLHERPQVLMLAVRSGDRAWPVLGRVAVTDGAIGFAVHKQLFTSNYWTPWLPGCRKGARSASWRTACMARPT